MERVFEICLCSLRPQKPIQQGKPSVLVIMARQEYHAQAPQGWHTIRVLLSQLSLQLVKCLQAPGDRIPNSDSNPNRNPDPFPLTYLQPESLS